MTEIKTVHYDPPLKDGDREVAVVHVRRLTVKDQIEVSKGGGTDAEKEITLISRATGLSVDTIGDMDRAEYEPLQQAVQNFPPRRRVTFDAPPLSLTDAPAGDEAKLKV